MIKEYAIRAVLGIVLSMLAVFVVEVAGIGLVVAAYGDLDTYLNRKAVRPEDLRVEGHVVCMLTGAGCGAVAASILAVLIAPIAYSSKAVLRSWLMAAGFGAVAGATFGAALGYPEIASFQTGMIRAAIAGAVVGICGTVVLRVVVNH